MIIFTKAAINALNNPSYMQLLINPEDLSLLLIGSDYQSPDSIRVSDIGKSPINQARQKMLAWAIDRAGWKKGYRYTVSAITLDVANRPALHFDMRKAVMRVPAMKNGLTGTAGIYMIVWSFPESSEKVLNYQRSQRLKSAGILHGSM